MAVIFCPFQEFGEAIPAGSKRSLCALQKKERDIELNFGLTAGT